jgi:hypothetical protein
MDNLDTKKLLYDMATPEQKIILDKQYEEKLKELEERKKEKIELLKKEPYRSDSFKGFIQHVPSMVSGVDAVYLETDKWEDILEFEFVQRFNKYGPFGITDDTTPMLMSLSELNNETGKYKSWWVVGYLKGFTPDEIPLDNYRDKIEQKTI